jgi:twitching motility protein PilT
MVSLNDALMELVTKKLVEPAEAYAKAVDKTGFDALLKRVGISVNAPPDPRGARPAGAPA